MKRKRGRPKKAVVKDPMPQPQQPPVNADEAAFLNFVGQNVNEDENYNSNENSESVELDRNVRNNQEFTQLNAEAFEFSSSSSSSSSSLGSEEESDDASFHVFDEPGPATVAAATAVVYRTVNELAKRRGRPKKVVARKGLNANAVDSATFMTPRGAGSGGRGGATVMSSRGVGAGGGVSSNVMSSRGGGRGGGATVMSSRVGVGDGVSFNAMSSRGGGGGGATVMSSRGGTGGRGGGATVMSSREGGIVCGVSSSAMSSRRGGGGGSGAPVMSSRVGVGGGVSSNAISSRGGGGYSSMSRKQLPQLSENPIQDSRYDKKALKSSLAVIKKVMEMDEAVPFNSPVDPVTQGISDYFSVIDTPMDFGTICSNLENGVKYMNSEDVYKDVECIWKNCAKFNKKGDYIVYLMKRVKRKFMKYWTAAGLSSEVPAKFSGKSHLATPSDHGVGRSRHEVSVANQLVDPSQMKQATFGSSQPQVPLSSYDQHSQSHLPQPGTTRAPQFPQSRAGVGSSETGHLHIPGPPVTAFNAEPQRSSGYLWHTQRSLGQPLPSRSHFSADINDAGQLHLPPTDSPVTHSGRIPRPSVDPMLSGMSQPPQHHRPNHRQLNESYQPQSSIVQPQPPQVLADAGISNAGMMHNDAGKREWRHKERYSTVPLVENALIEANSMPLQPSASQNHENGFEGSTTRKRRKVRGPTRCRFMFDIPEGERIFVPVNMLGQPVGAEASKLASFLGTVARDGNMAPLNFLDWSAMPETYKEDMWQFVQTRFEMDPICKNWVMKSLATKWRNWKAKLKADHYNPHTNDEERLKDCNKRVHLDQWAALIEHWNSEKVQIRCAKNKANRAKHRSVHASGSKSFARIREEEKAKRSNGKELSRGELYILTRTRKDGQPVDETAAEMISKLREHASQKQQTSDGSNDYADSYCMVMGEDKRSHVRMYGLGPSYSDIYGRKPSRNSLFRIAMETKRSANEEVSKVLNKMEAMEEKYASLEAQIASMSSSLQNVIDKIESLSSTQVPNNAPEDSLQAHGQSSSSSHAAEVS